jgi:hypothetical protein
MALYGLLLLAASLFDYIGNSAFYFGGKPARQSRKFVFICSPLRGGREENIRCAQWYCKQLINTQRPMFGSELTPFAPHAFFTYFLSDDVDKERLLGRRCALAFLNACDAVYVYVPYLENRTITRHFQKHIAHEADVSSGMKAEIEEAKQMGLDIRYRERISPPAEWRPSMPGPMPNQGEQPRVNSKFVDEPLRRVFVCTPLQGNNGTVDLTVLGRNIQIALQCCRTPALDEKPVAPFAPQAFYPFFWAFLNPDRTIDGAKREAWFSRSLDVLKLCDAVYFFTSDGLPDPASMSPGMRKVKDLAVALGLECVYMCLPPLNAEWTPAVPDFAALHNSGAEAPAQILIKQARASMDS